MVAASVSGTRDPAADPPHWFVLDLDILRGYGHTLAVRSGGPSRPLDPARVHAFTRRVLARVERELGP